MKKIFMIGLVLAAALVAQAQTKVAPQLAKGMEKTYVAESSANIPGQGDVKITCETRYTVSDATTDGYVFDVVTTDVKTDADASNIAGQLMAASEEMLKGLTLRVATDKDGRAERVLNYAEVRQKMDALADATVEKLFKGMPMLEQAMPKDVLKQQVLEAVSEEGLVKSLQNTTSPLSLNGKTIMTGAQEEYTNGQGMKMKRMYFVTGQTITTNSTLNMSNDDLKALVIAQVEKMAPDQAEMIKQNIDAVMASGMMKFDAKETATFQLQDDGWVKSIKAESTNEAMGQSTKVNTVVTLK